MASEDSVLKELRTVLLQVDLDSATEKSVRAILQEKFQEDLTPHKQAIKVPCALLSVCCPPPPHPAAQT